MTRSPRLARPRSRAMLVAVPVSSMNTSRAGSKAGCSAFQAARGGDVRLLLLGGVHDLFEADAFGGGEPPHRPEADMDPASPELGADFLQRQIWNRRDPVQQPRPLAIQAGAVIRRPSVWQQLSAQSGASVSLAQQFGLQRRPRTPSPRLRYRTLGKERCLSVET